MPCGFRDGKLGTVCLRLPMELCARDDAWGMDVRHVSHTIYQYPVCTADAYPTAL